MPNIQIQGKSVSLELAFNLPPKRAVEYLQAKGVEINFDWETASDEAKARAFTAAGVYKLDILSDLKELVTQAIEKGTPYNEFKTQMLSALASKGYIPKNEGLAPYRLKNIYRQNIQTAYQAGSYKDLDESKKYLPYWKFIAIDDARTTVGCRGKNGTILPADDPFWDKNFPPNHFGCRSNIMGMTKEQATKEGITSAERRNTIMEDNPPAKGFDYNPGKGWEPDLSKYDKELVEQYLKENK